MKDDQKEVALLLQSASMKIGTLQRRIRKAQTENSRVVMRHTDDILDAIEKALTASTQISDLLDEAASKCTQVTAE